MVDIAQGLFSTRRGSIIVGLAAAALAGIVVFVYLHNYRSSVSAAAAPATVLVSKNLIPKGTPGNIVAEKGQFQVTSIPRKQLQIGALTDPKALAGRIAAVDIYPNQQLTAQDFVYAAPGTIQTQLTGADRAINVSLDPVHGMAGDVNAGDRIDVFVAASQQGIRGSEGVIHVLMTNVLVLRAPVAGGGGIFTLRVPEAQAAWLAAAHDYAHLWFVVRPASGAKVQLPGNVSVQFLLRAYKALK